MKHSINMRWLANRNQGSGHFSHNFLELVCISYSLHSKLRSITHVATIVHAMLWSFVVLTWMHGIIELTSVACNIME